MNSTPLYAAALTAGALLAAVIGLFAAARRGHWLATLLFSSAFLSMAAFQAGSLGILQTTSETTARMWATYLAGVSALVSWLWLALSVVLARPDPVRQIRQAVAYLTLALVGCGILFSVAGTRWVVSGVRGMGADAFIALGGMGKVYLMYLLVVMVAVLMNLETTLRTAPASAQKRLRQLFVAFVLGILAELLVVSAGLLYGGIQVVWLALSAPPLFVAGSMTAFALARQRLSDMSVPVARPVIYYSSVSLTLAGAFLITMAALSKVIPVLSPEWKRLVTGVFYLLLVGGGLVLTLSPRASRMVKRFIDRNFYANRYDYRREWERVSHSLTPTARPEELYAQVQTLLQSVFEADRIAIHLLDERSGDFRLVFPPGRIGPAEGDVAASSRLGEELHRQRAPLVFHHLTQDLDLIPLAVENRPMIQALGAAVVAPLHVGDQLIGMLWLSEKRTDDEYSFEDMEFLGAMSTQLAAFLWFARIADQLVETRQLESLHRLSSFVLHDIKNQVSGLSLVVENARRHGGDPEFQRDALKVVERTVHNLRQLMSQVAGVARRPEVRPQSVRVRQVVEDAASFAGLAEGERDGVRFTVRCDLEASAQLDPELMARVLTNLMVNAREALAGHGEIEVRASFDGTGTNGGGMLTLSVRDNGRGMNPTFVRDSLFRPFATTKPSGLGIGLVQSKAIVEAHGGTIRVESEPGRGTCFEVRVPVMPQPAASQQEKA